MNTLIPLPYYETFYHSVLLLFVLIVFIQANNCEIYDSSNLRQKNSIGIFLFVAIVLYMGLRPVSFAFGDMGIYAQEYKRYQLGMKLQLEKDVLFQRFMQFSSFFLPVGAFFFLCSFLYIYPLFLFSRKIFKQYWFYCFLMFVISFSFWAYGVNGIRNGIATSLFIFAISRTKKAFVYTWFFILVFIHSSMVVPIAAYVLATYYKNIKMYLIAWVLAIPISLVLGSFLEMFFLKLGLIEEQKLIGYLSGNDQYLDKLVQVKTGFRWDFLLYSSIGVYAGWYYIFKKKFDDVFYKHVYSIYLICNALWILVIRANFSNRFAYLSWFLLAIVIVYPFLKAQMVTQQHKLLGKIIFVYFLFTFLFNVILIK